MLTFLIDASNSLCKEALGTLNDEEVNQFCEWSREKTKGKYNGWIIADYNKLEKDPTLKNVIKIVW